MSRWLFAFVFTQVIEGPIWWRGLPAERPGPARILLALLPTTLTHPIVWFVIPSLLSTWVVMFALAECFAVLAEAALARALGLSWKHALVLSLVANGLSAGLGLVSQTFFGLP
jgi:NADH:ubiquinone oxidoreductase subunit H